MGCHLWGRTELDTTEAAAAAMPSSRGKHRSMLMTHGFKLVKADPDCQESRIGTAKSMHLWEKYSFRSYLHR